MKLKERAQKLKTDIPAIFLSLKDKRTPVWAKIFAAITVAYALSPIDLIPDFIPVLGYLDDVVLLPALIAVTVRMIPKDVLEDNRKAAEKLHDGSVTKKWYYAVGVVLFWALIIFLIVKAVRL
ncbi:MAG: YkvA family protein [Acutalibacteraceae bacterium]